MKILIYGGGKSNLALIRHLNLLNIEYDVENKKDYYDYIVKSPGLRLDDTPKNGNIISDIEFLYILHHPTIIGITGSNGKTTTTLLTYELLKEHIKLKLGGNIGIPFSNVYIDNDYTYLLELSSFELETSSKLKCHVAVLLNINYCHMDHHDTFDDYINSKLNIINNQANEDFVIYNYDDLILRKKLENHNATKLSFSIDSSNADMYINEDRIYFKDYVIYLNNLNYNTTFDLKNIMASLLICYVYNLNLYDLIDVINNYKKPKYRLEKLKDNIYNDAKSTNVYSTKEAIKSLGKVNLILGGYDRGEDLRPLFEEKDSILECFIYGENKDKIKSVCKENKIKCHTYKTLKKASNEALKRDGIILYSPASASFDQYKGFEERGIEFENIVLNKEKDGE